MMRRCKFSFGQGKWQDGIFHRWYETGGDNNTLAVVFEDDTGLTYNLIASAVKIQFIEPPKETMPALQVPNELTDAFIELLEVMLSAHLYDRPEVEIEPDELRVLNIIEAFVERELVATRRL